MTILEMLGQSAVLTVLGITVVFSFLAIMVLCVSALGKFFSAREAALALAGNTQAAAPDKSSGTSAAGKIAAISAALNEYSKAQ